MKTRYKLGKRIATWVAVLSIGAHTMASAGETFSGIIFLGDSLSDPGNVYQLTGETSQPPYAIIPDRPYDIRGFQFSNDKTWAQWFARHMEMKRSGMATFQQPMEFGNFAYGGARARFTAVSPRVPSAEEQLGIYLQTNAVDANKLYVIQFGGNDIRDALERFVEVLDDIVPPGQDPTQAQIDFATFEASKIIQAAVEANLRVIQNLHYLGASNFLVATVPDVGLTPAIRFAGPEASFIASSMSGFYNQGLDAGLASLQAIPGIEIDRLDLHAIVGAIIEDPQSFGIRNVDTPCLNFGVTVGAICRKPDKHLFWDGIHPTGKVHKIVSEYAAAIYAD